MYDIYFSLEYAYIDEHEYCHDFGCSSGFQK